MKELQNQFQCSCDFCKFEKAQWHYCQIDDAYEELEIRLELKKQLDTIKASAFRARNKSNVFGIWSCGCTNVRVAVKDFKAKCLNCQKLFELKDAKQILQPK